MLLNMFIVMENESGYFFVPIIIEQADKAVEKKKKNKRKERIGAS